VPSGSNLFNLQFVLSETLILLTSSFTCGLAILATKRDNRRQLIVWFLVTFLLGATFLFMELSEFYELFKQGHDWTKSAFLSSYFSLVGTHGLHIAAGLIWLLVLLGKLLASGLSQALTRKFTLFSLFWHFLDVVWIFIFSIVYLIK
jgi:cytochrome o ubiquinol oxidase subunit 3